MIKAVLFDMDGVLIDNDLFEEMNERYILGFYATQEGISRKKAYEKWAKILTPLRHTKEWHDWRLVCERLGLGKIWLEAHIQNLKYLKLLPGARQLIEKLSSKHILGIASDAIKEVVDIKLGYFELLRNFEHIFSQDSFNSIKNDTQYFKRMLAELKLRPTEVVLVDDRARGINTASKLGIRTVHIPYNYMAHKTVQPLIKKESVHLNADFSVKKLSEIEGILNKLSK